MESAILGLVIVLVVVGCLILILPIVALVRIRRIRELQLRLAGVEAALVRIGREQPPSQPPLQQQQQGSGEPGPRPPAAALSPEAAAALNQLSQRVAQLEAAVGRMPAVANAAAPPPPPPFARQPELPPPVVQPVAPPPSPLPPPLLPQPLAQPPPTAPEAPPRQALPPGEHLEAVIGQRWIAAIAILLIFGSVVFFLKYAFDNQWIGELGRVTLGVIGGLVFVWGGLERHRKGWRYLSQILTGGGAIILYLSVYGAFGYYHLIDSRTAFVFLAILVAETQLLALLYDAPAIAVLALLGGFLSPVLLSTGRDQYAILFTYIVLLDLAMLGVVTARNWRWVGLLAYVGTQFLYAVWYSEHYHPEKRAAVLLFQTVVFLIFVLVALAPHLRRAAAGWEEWVRLAVNPFVYFAICYDLLEGDYHHWMAVFALAMAIVYAVLARAELSLRPRDRSSVLVTLATALAFVTIAIPVQLDANWITIGWAVEAAALLWAGFQVSARPLRWMSALVFALAVGRFLFEDTPWSYRATFTPVFNRYFLGMLALVACLAAAAWLHRRLGPAGTRAAMGVGLLAFGVLWLGSSFEAYTYFSAKAQVVESHRAIEGTDVWETARQLRWAGQLALSVLWSAYAGLLTAGGFRYQLRPLRVAGLALFGLTLAKVMVIDISELRQFYRILALLALGLVLLRVAWAYQRGLKRERKA